MDLQKYTLRHEVHMTGTYCDENSLFSGCDCFGSDPEELILTSGQRLEDKD